MDAIESFFEPDGIAVVGASNDPDKPGYTLFRNLVNSYDGDVYPVNPNQESVLGIECHSSVGGVPGDVELVSILIPAPSVPAVLEECVDAGVKAVYVGSEGFADVGEAGKELQDEIVEIARRGGVRLWGPNCGGYISSKPSLSNNYLMDTEGHAEEHLGGSIAYIAQSGMIAGGIYLEVITEGILDIGKSLTIGNRADVAEPDLLRYLGDDPATDVVGIYQESVKHGRDLVEALEDLSPEKPVVILKGGRSSHGARAAESHTGSLAGDDDVADAAFRQFGAIRVPDFRQLLNVTKAFSMYPDGMHGDRIALLTMTGAGAVVASDLLADHGLEPAELEASTVARLDRLYPDWMTPENPVDIWMSITEHGIDDTLVTCLEALLDDEGVDGVLLQALAFDYFEGFDFPAFVEVASRSDKPVVTWLVGEQDYTPNWEDGLEAGDVPVYRDLSSCAQVFGALRTYGRWLDRHAGRDRVANAPPDRVASVRATLQAVRADGRTTLTEGESKALLAEWGLPVTREALAESPADAVRLADEIGYPVALKISSRDLVHKADVGGIALDLDDAESVEAAYDRIHESVAAARPDARTDGVLVSEMVDGGREVIIGVTTDPEFGPVLLFGLGGTYVEVIDDVALRIPPVTAATAREMVSEIDASPVLDGARGGPVADIEAIIECLLSVADLAVEFGDELAELDINPLFVREAGEGIVAADAVIRLEG